MNEVRHNIFNAILNDNVTKANTKPCYFTSKVQIYESLGPHICKYKLLLKTIVLQFQYLVT